MKLSKVFYSAVMCLALIGCNQQSTTFQQVKTPYMNLSVPNSWTHFDQSSWDMVPEVLKNDLDAGAFVVGYDKNSLNNFYMIQEPLFDDFAMFKQNYLQAYPYENNKKLDFRVIKSNNLVVDGIEALQIVSTYRKVWPVTNREGRQLALNSYKMQVVSLALNWPLHGVTIINCEENGDGSCMNIAGTIKTVAPDLSAYLNGEPYRTEDYQAQVPSGWYKVPAGLSPVEIQKLPPLVKSIYNGQEEMNFLSPDSNFMVTLNKVKVDLKLDDEEQLNAWSQSIFENASAKSAGAPVNVGLVVKNGLQRVVIEDLAFRENNPKIMTKLAYVLNNGFAIGVTCTYHQANKVVGLAACEQVLDSIAFAKKPLRLVARPLDETRYNLTVPKGWFALKNLVPEEISALPEQVSRQYNKDNKLSWQLINRDIPDDILLELINVSYADEMLSFAETELASLEDGIKTSLEANYQNINKTASFNQEINGRPAHFSRWSYQLNNGLALNSWQTFVVCDRGTVISTCVFQQAETERVGKLCNSVSASIRCK